MTCLQIKEIYYTSLCMEEGCLFVCVQCIFAHVFQYALQDMPAWKPEASDVKCLPQPLLHLIF